MWFKISVWYLSNRIDTNEVFVGNRCTSNTAGNYIINSVPNNRRMLGSQLHTNLEMRDRILEILGTRKLLCTCEAVTGTSITIIVDMPTLSLRLKAWQHGIPSVQMRHGIHSMVTQYLYRADDADFTFGNGTNDSAFSVFVPVSCHNVTSRTVIGKWDETAAGEQREWRLFFDANGYPNVQLYDESANAYIGTRSDRILLWRRSVENSWIYL